MCIFLLMSPLNTSIDLLAELDNVSKIHTLERETIDEVMLIMAKKIVSTLHVERMSVWLLNPERDGLISMGEYDRRDDSFRKDTLILKAGHEPYFDAIQSNRILYARDVRVDPQTSCFNEDYNIPNEVISLLDIPMRLEGELIGVMCFEKTGGIPKEFSLDEQSFAFSVSIIFVSNLEARYRRTAQHALENSLREKELLIKEMNHRVKNNFAILLSLLRISKEQGHDQSPDEILEEYQHRIFSMMKVHDLLFESGNYNQIRLGDYLFEIFNEYRNSHPELSDKLKLHVQDLDLIKSSKEGLYLGLIITEIFFNAIKHALKVVPDFCFSMSYYTEGDRTIIELADNGPGFDFEKESERSTLGLSLIQDLIEEMDMSVELPSKGHCVYRIVVDS
jgi:two-component sensor histidine kinase